MNYRRIPWVRNHKCEQPSRLIFLDTETLACQVPNEPTHERHILRLGVAKLYVKTDEGFRCKDVKRFTISAEFFGWFYSQLRKRKPTWVYAHNIAFDFTILGGWTEIDQGRLRIFEHSQTGSICMADKTSANKTWRGKTALDGVPFILECRTDTGPCKFIDTYNYWNVQLEKLGRYVGLEKLEWNPIDWNMDNLWEYCERDVDIIASAVTRLMSYWKENDCGNWQPTIAGLAYSAFRHGKESCAIVAHGDERYGDMEAAGSGNDRDVRTMDCGDVSDVERRAYFGGRTECYYVGKVIANAMADGAGSANLFRGTAPQISGPITVFDVNSMYPFCMKEYKHPIELMDAIRQPSMDTARRLIEKFWCCADVEVDTDGESYPKRHGQFVIYPTGRFSTTLCGSELQQAFVRGDCRGIANLCVYHSGRPFRGFIDTWHSRRMRAIEAGKDVEQRFCNLMMQALYGKLAQQTPMWKTCGLEIPPVRWGTYFGQKEGNGLPCIMRAIGGVSQYQGERRNCRHTFTAAAASVTSAARTYMQSLIGMCPLNSIVYMDTDSLFCLPQATRVLTDVSLVHPTQLGMLKIKGVYDNVVIHGQKDYELDGVRVIAGLRSDAIEISERLWKQINIEGVKSVIQHDPDMSIIAKSIRFAPSSQLQCRSVQWDGWTKPLIME